MTTSPESPTGPRTGPPLATPTVGVRRRATHPRPVRSAADAAPPARVRGRARDRRLRRSAADGAPAVRAHGRARDRRLVRSAAVTALGVGAVTVLSAAVLASAGSADPSRPPAPAGTYRLPLAGPADVARAFEPPPEPWAAGHRGVDLRSAPGSPALSPVAGVVTFAGPVAGRGVVTVTDPNGRRSSVEPVLASVRAGDPVGAGEALGVVLADGSHCAPATCLHWGVRVGEDYVDPLALLPGEGPVVLLPMDAAGATGTRR